MSDSFATPWTVVHQASLSMGFPRQEYWSNLPFPSPGNLPNPGSEPTSPALADGVFTTEPPGKPLALLVEADKLSAQKLSQMGSVQPAVLCWFSLCPPFFFFALARCFGPSQMGHGKGGESKRFQCGLREKIMSMCLPQYL